MLILRPLLISSFLLFSFNSNADDDDMLAQPHVTIEESMQIASGLETIKLHSTYFNPTIETFATLGNSQQITYPILLVFLSVFSVVKIVTSLAMRRVYALKTNKNPAQ